MPAWVCIRMRLIGKNTIILLSLWFSSTCVFAACADAKVEDHSVTFANNCSYYVFWTIECVASGAGCFGSGNVRLEPNKSITKGYSAAVIVYGPYKD